MTARKARAGMPRLALVVSNRPDWCGECDERWIETPRGLAKCPRCYPAEVAS